MVSGVKELFHTFNMPFLQAPEKNQYDFSDGASYSFLIDYGAYATAITVSLVYLRIFDSFSSHPSSLIFSTAESAQMAALCGFGGALATRVFAFNKDPETETYSKQDFLNLYGLAGYGFIALVVIPICTNIPFVKTCEWAIRAAFPPIPLSIALSIQLFSHLADCSNKGKALSSNYSVHHEKILQLPLDSQKRIFSQLSLSQPPKEILNHPPPILKNCMMFPHTFIHELSPDEVKRREHLIQYCNPVLSWLRLSTYPSVEESVTNDIKENLKRLSLHQVQWLIINLSTNPDYELSVSHFSLLKDRAQEFTETDSTGLINKLKIANSVEHLKKLINDPE